MEPVIQGSVLFSLSKLFHLFTMSLILILHWLTRAIWYVGINIPYLGCSIFKHLNIGLLKIKTPMFDMTVKSRHRTPWIGVFISKYLTLPWCQNFKDGHPKYQGILHNGLILQACLSHYGSLVFLALLARHPGMLLTIVIFFFFFWGVPLLS